MPSPHKNHAPDGLDETDLAIVVELQADGRITNTDLAARVGLSPSATLRRVRTLEEQGVIDHYTAVCDPERLGRGTTVFVEISLANQSGTDLVAFEEGVLGVAEVVSCHLMAGDADYLLQVGCRDVADFERIHRDHLVQLPGVTRVRSSFALRAVARTR